MAVSHLIPVFGDGPMRMPPVGPCTVVEAPNDGVIILMGGGPAVKLNARLTRQLAEQLLFVLDGSVIVATNRLEGY